MNIEIPKSMGVIVELLEQTKQKMKLKKIFKIHPKLGKKLKIKL